MVVVVVQEVIEVVVMEGEEKGCKVLLSLARLSASSSEASSKKIEERKDNKHHRQNISWQFEYQRRGETRECERTSRRRRERTK